MNTQIYNVIPGKPFGRGIDGSATISSDPHTRRTCNGSSGSKTLTLSSGAYSNGDLILIHQSRGLSSASEQNWEINQIVSGGGTSTLTLLNKLGRTYTTSGYNFAQVVDIKEYANLTINSFTVSGWNYSSKVGGFVALVARGLVTWAGTITCAGASGSASMSDQGGAPSTGYGGFRGGANSMDGSHAWSGEGYSSSNWPPLEQQAANGNGGGGGDPNGDKGGGGGGGASAGSTASNTGGFGGSACGNVALTSAVFGGGGGGGRNDGDQAAGGGGNGGGGFFGWLRILQYSSGGLNLNGGNGGSSSAGATSGGGGGGGGFGLFNIFTATVNTNFRALAGAGQNNGGNGGNGRFRINYVETPSGNTNPAASTAQDVQLSQGSNHAQVVL